MPHISQHQIDAARARGLVTVPTPGDYKRNKGAGYTGPGGIQVGSRNVANSSTGLPYEARRREQEKASQAAGVPVADKGMRNEWHVYQIKSGNTADVQALLQSLPPDKRIWIVAKGTGGTSEGKSSQYVTVLRNTRNQDLQDPGSRRLAELETGAGAFDSISEFTVYVKD